MLVRCSPAQVILEPEVFPSGISVLVIQHLWRLGDKAGVSFIDDTHETFLKPFIDDKMHIQGHAWGVKAYSLTEQGIPPEVLSRGSFLVSSACEPFVPADNTPPFRRTSLSVYPLQETSATDGTTISRWCLNVAGVELRGQNLMPREHVCIALPTFDPLARVQQETVVGLSLWERILLDD